MAYYLDYSAAKLSGATIQAAGYTGVIRYIDAPDRLRTKHTTLVEYQDHVAHGLDVRLVFQNTTTDPDGGYAAGVANAQRALAGARYLGYNGEIYFCNDRTTLPDPSAWRAYLDGAASVLGIGRVGAYGFMNAQNAAIGHASAFWQSGRRSDLVAHANFWQDNNTQVTVGGVLCDRNLVLKTTEVDDLPYTDAQLKDIVQSAIYDARDQNGRNVLDQGLQTSWDVASLSAQIAGLQAAVAALATNPALSPEAMSKIVADAVAQHVQITGTVKIGPAL